MQPIFPYHHLMMPLKRLRHHHCSRSRRVKNIVGSVATYCPAAELGEVPDNCRLRAESNCTRGDADAG
jgi:hypothetical protein